MMGDFIHLSQRFFSMTRINHADWAVAFLSMTRINHADWAMHDPMDIRDLDYFPARCKAGSFTAVARNAHIVRSAGCTAAQAAAASVSCSLSGADRSEDLSQLPAGAGKWRRVIGGGKLAPAGRFVS